MKSTEEEIQTIKTLLKDFRTAKYHKRLQIVLFRLMGKSYKEIIDLLDCNKTTIWRNVKKYEEFGLDSLLQETRGGRNHAYMTVEEEKAFLARHLKATEAGEFVTIPYFRLISFLHT
ncbi:transposase [Streptococcus pneumoniae]|nr:transposase [Streptococcus pneumoniae]